MHILVPIAFVLIIASMVSALYFMMHGKGKTKRMVWSLATRVGLSISLFLFILSAHWMVWIQSTGIPYGRRSRRKKLFATPPTIHTAALHRPSSQLPYVGT